MRRFVVVGHEAPTTPDFSLSDLAGGAGRLDVLCRCVAAGLLTSHGVRPDASVWLVLQDAVTVRFDGGAVRNLAPDERAVAGLVRSALEAAAGAVGAQWVDSSPGVAVASQGLEAALAAADGAGLVVELHEDGVPVTDLAPPEAATFVLSDHRDFTAEERSLLDEYADVRVRLGPERLHADQAMVVAHNYLDTAGFSSY
ncbi:MAG: tRNA (pseudouridine(54)-N(1))-methyltransferase TrmY [Halobacteriales archaeon]